MVQVVFVHGVTVRSGQSYEIGSKSRDALFRSAAFADAAHLDVENPYWGGSASTLAWKGASLRMPDEVKSFALADRGGSDRHPRLAGLDTAVIVDALFTALVVKRQRLGQPLGADDLRLFAAAGIYAASQPDATWRTPDMSDDAVAAGLAARIGDPGGVQTFGLGSTIREAAEALAGRTAHAVGGVVAGLAREPAAVRVASFLGDALLYMKDGPARSAIRATVGEALKQVHGREQGRGKIVAIGHSFGGVVLHDLLSNPGSLLPSGLEVDLLVTVGSQVGLFEELKLFEASERDVPRPGKPQAAAGARVLDWINVFDRVDLLGYAAAPIFRGCTDYTFDTADGLFGSHGAYFTRPSFHQRLREHLRAGGITP